MTGSVSRTLPSRHGRTSLYEDVTITRALFEYDNPEAPLSWHLTRADKEEIDKQWKAELDRSYNTCAGWHRVRSFLTDQKATNGP